MINDINKRVLIWRFTLVLIKINYGQIGDQKGLFYTTILIHQEDSKQINVAEKKTEEMKKQNVTMENHMHVTNQTDPNVKNLDTEVCVYIQQTEISIH
jgi:hypothetical protein